jgi:hypothetical protein
LVVVATAAALLGVAVRVNNALRYPPDWGFDASFNWRYIYRMANDWALPHPSAGWSTADPPLFFSAAAGLMAASGFQVSLVPLFNSVLGLAIIAMAMMLARDAQPERPLRTVLAGGLLLYLPAHIQMSAMVSEEMLSAFFISMAVFLLARRERDGSEPLPRSAAVGLATGLGLLTKLTSAVAGIAAVGTYALDGLRRRAFRPALTALAATCAVALLVGGWFYARNHAIYGSAQPFGLPAHQLMFEMPPGERSVADYLRFPVSTFTDPQLLDPDLLRSVWGSTYATVWFDGHRFFLPRGIESVRRLGTACLLLALLPTAAFGVGLLRGLRRCAAGDGAADIPLLLLVAVSFAGYAFYTWQNPWFAVVKGTSLLGLSLPFAYYASEELDRWIRRSRATAAVVGGGLALLAFAVILSTTFNLAFEKTEVSGLPWKTTGDR